MMWRRNNTRKVAGHPEQTWDKKINKRTPQKHNHVVFSYGFVSIESKSQARRDETKPTLETDELRRGAVRTPLLYN